MPKKSFYLTDEDLKVYEKAKEYVGDSLSGFIMQNLRKLVEEKENENSEMKEIRLWVGNRNNRFNVEKGEYVKFVGRQLSKASVNVKDDINIDYELYESRKRKLLLYIKNDQTETVDYGYKIFDDYNKLTRESGLPSTLLGDAENKLKDIKCVDLDI